MILAVPSKFLVPSPVKLCGTEVKVAKTGRFVITEQRKRKWAGL